MIRCMPQRQDSQHEQADPPVGNSSIQYPTDDYCGEEIVGLEMSEAIRNVVRRAQHEMGNVLYDEMIFDFEDIITSAAEEPHPKEEEMAWRRAHEAWKKERTEKKEKKLIKFWLIPGQGGQEFFHSLYYIHFYEDEFKDDLECYKQWNIIENLISLPDGVGFDPAMKMFKTNVRRYVNERSSTFASHMPTLTRMDLLSVHQSYFCDSDTNCCKENGKIVNI